MKMLNKKETLDRLAVTSTEAKLLQWLKWILKILVEGKAKDLNEIFWQDMFTTNQDMAIIPLAEEIIYNYRKERVRNWVVVEDDYDRQEVVHVLKAKTLFQALKEMDMWNTLKHERQDDNGHLSKDEDGTFNLSFYYHCGHEHDCCGCVHCASYTFEKLSNGTMVCVSSISRNF